MVTFSKWAKGQNKVKDLILSVVIMDKHHENGRERVPFIRIESKNSRGSNVSISSCSSEESIPTDAPLAHQQRCSVDIDTMISKSNVKAQINGLPKHHNAYLDDLSVNDSIQDIAWVQQLINIITDYKPNKKWNKTLKF